MSLAFCPLQDKAKSLKSIKHSPYLKRMQDSCYVCSSTVKPLEGVGKSITPYIYISTFKITFPFNEPVI